MIITALLLAAATPAAPAQHVRPATLAVPAHGVLTTPSGLRFQVLRRGTGRRPLAQDAVNVTYEGRLTDGTLFDASVQPVGFPVAGLIPGFTEALLLMNEGGRYRFWIPSALGYGPDGSPPAIPPNAELVFTVALVGVGAAAPAP